MTGYSSATDNLKRAEKIQQVENPFAHAAKLPLEDAPNKQCEECKGKDLQISVMEMEIQGYRDSMKRAILTLQKYLDKTNLDD